MINWALGTKGDFILISQIARRAKEIVPEFDLMSLKMDLQAVHTHGCPLDLKKLQKFDNGNFGHDVFGIRRYIDRETGELTDCFIPRCARS